MTTRRTFLKAATATTAGVVGLSGSVAGQADEIVFYNAGSLEFDEGTAANIERFEEETGISVNVNEVPWDNLKTSLITLWRNESSEVDAFNGPTWWLPDFIAADWIQPLELSDDHMSKYPENLRELVTFEGSTYMAPEFGKWGNYLYDAEYLEEQGVDSPPDTWDEVIDIGAELSSGDRSGFGFTWANKDVFMFKQFVYQAGGQLFNEESEPVFTDTGTQVFEEFITPLREEGILPSGISAMEEGDIGDGFIAGEFATVEAWTPLAPRAFEDDDWGTDRLGSALPPEGPASRATFQDTNGISVSAFSEREEAAKQFAEFMTTTESSKENMLVEGNPSVVPEVYEDSEVQDAYPSEWLEHMQYNLENAQSESYLAQPQVDDYLSEQITPALLGEEDPREALETAQENITGLYQDLGVL